MIEAVGVTQFTRFLGTGIDEYLGQLYGKDSKASVKLSLAGSQLVDGASLRTKVLSSAFLTA